MTYAEALQQLKDGNLRFVENRPARGAQLDRKDRYRLAEGQLPFAVVLGCSDSRVPVETIFDQGFGALFVIRIAGNVVSDTQIGSVEFAIEQFGTPLVVVLGHSDCGAILATLEAARKPSDFSSPNVRSIVDRIKPCLEAITLEDEEAAAKAVRANVKQSVVSLLTMSDILARKVDAGELAIIGAEYNLDSGHVEFIAEG